MSRFIPGLVSITFRALSPRQVIDLVQQADLQTIEWGGDIHVPVGDVARAREVGRQTREAGLSVTAYGSYYRLGSDDAQASLFPRVLESAVALGAPTVRVWAGGKSSSETSPPERDGIVADAFRVADLAREAGVRICLEYHAGTLTDTRESVLRLMEEISHPRVDFLWQPAPGETAEEGVTRLREVSPRLGHTHIFHWWPTAAERRPLREGGERWGRYLASMPRRQEGLPCLLEFVRGDDVEQFREDAATLLRWLAD